MKEEDKALTFCFYAQFLNQGVSLSIFLLLGGPEALTKSMSSSYWPTDLCAFTPIRRP